MENEEARPSRSARQAQAARRHHGDTSETLAAAEEQLTAKAMRAAMSGKTTTSTIGSGGSSPVLGKAQLGPEELAGGGR